MPSSLKKVISKQKLENEAIERKREAEREQRIQAQKRKEKLKNLKIHESSQIVFWLDEEEQTSIFSDWHVSTGVIQSGKNKGKPKRPARIQPNSAVVLTVRAADQPEEERRIQGLYMVSESFSNKLDEEGIIPAHEGYRIRLTNEESDKMLFWNYYVNKTYPHRMTWNSGKYRYFDNVWTAQILKDIMALRTDEAQVQEIQKFLEYFCKLNALDMDDIPEPSGALKPE